MGALAHAYFDESGHDKQSRRLIVAGYIFEKQNAIDIDTDWRYMLDDYGLPFFHMKECVHKLGVFAHLSRSETDEAARRAIALIQKYASRGIAIAVDVNAFPMIPLFGKPHTPYTFACVQVIYGIQRWADEAQFTGDVAYFFEAGVKGHGLVIDTLDEIVAVAKLKNVFHHESHTFIGKDAASQLQCADMLAWHINKHLRNRDEGKRRRKDFGSLLGVPTDFHHFDKESISEWIASDADLQAA